MCNNAQMMTDWNDLKYVLETVRQGGLSGAARKLGVNHATVSRRINSAEESIGAVLFDRLPGGYVPTSAGLDAARIAEKMEAADSELSLKIGARDQRLSGPLSITAPQLLFERVLAPIFASFGETHPDIELKMRASNETLNLAQREADIAVRISNKPVDTLIGSKVAEQKSAVYTSVQYAKDLAANPEQQLSWIQFAHWVDAPSDINKFWPHWRTALVVDDMVAAIGAVKAHMGATRMPCFLADDDPQLVRLEKLGTFNYPPIWVLTHRDMYRVKRIQIFRDFLTKRLRQLRPVFAGMPKA